MKRAVVGNTLSSEDMKLLATTGRGRVLADNELEIWLIDGEYFITRKILPAGSYSRRTVVGKLKSVLGSVANGPAAVSEC